MIGNRKVGLLLATMLVASNMVGSGIFLLPAAPGRHRQHPKRHRYTCCDGAGNPSYLPPRVSRITVQGTASHKLRNAASKTALPALAKTRPISPVRSCSWMAAWSSSKNVVPDRQSGEQFT